MQDADGSDDDQSETEHPAQVHPSRKRKRGAADNLEDAYMQKLAREEEREKSRRKIEKAKKDEDAESNASAESDEENSADSEEEDDAPPPVHETVSGATEAQELDKSNRTVFLGNVSNTAISSKSDKKALLAHLSSFFTKLPKSDTPHKIESIRFRSTAYGTEKGVPRRAAFAHKETMDSTTLSTNAYVVYSTSIAAQKAPGALNGTVVLDRHLRVDNVAHPAAVDNKRCVFVGNLAFVGQENDADGDEETPKKKNSPPADVEEGLWRTFNTNTGVAGKKNAGGGNVESVRVVRDQATRVGKGFAYVQFHDENCVEAALLLGGKKFPPLLPRKLRVTRARKMGKKRDSNPRKAPATDSAHSTLRGRVKKLLGRAGAAKLRNDDDGKPFIFEGQRAVEKTDQFKFKRRGSKGSKGKPKNRSSKRAETYRASGGRAARKVASD